MASAAFERFRFSFFEDKDSARQGLDTDADGLVRHHAARGLLKLHGLPTPCDDYHHIIYRVMADEPVTREAAKRDVLAAIEGRAIGAQ